MVPACRSRPAEPGGTLDIAGTFAASGNGPTAQFLQHGRESFPPEELFAAREGHDVVDLFR